MSKGRVNQKRYKYPLPIHPVDDLPELILHNPLSWLYWAYRYYKSTNALNDKVHVDFIGDTTLHITVQDDKQMLYLWNNGFLALVNLAGVSLHGKLEQRPDWVSMILPPQSGRNKE